MVGGDEMSTKKFNKYFISLLLVISFITFVTKASKVTAVGFNVSDTADNTSYHLNQTEDILHIKSNNYSAKIHIPDEIVNVLCKEGTFSLLCVSKASPNTYFYTIREYNIYSQNLTTIATNTPAVSGQQDFYTDNNGTYYITDTQDSRKIHIITEDTSDCITAPSIVYQLLSVDNSSLLTFTGKGTYLLSGKSFMYLTDLLPDTPCNYLGNGIVTDSKNKRYILSDTSFSEVIESSAIHSTNTGNTPQDAPIITKGNLIFISGGTTFAKLYKNLGIEKSELKVYKTDGNKVTSGSLGTGMLAEFSGKSYSLIVAGDLTGEGNINSRDLKALMNHLTDEVPLKEPYLTAADLHNDKKIDTKDLLALSKLY